MPSDVILPAALPRLSLSSTFSLRKGRSRGVRDGDAGSCRLRVVKCCASRKKNIRTKSDLFWPPLRAAAARNSRSTDLRLLAELQKTRVQSFSASRLREDSCSTMFRSFCQKFGNHGHLFCDRLGTRRRLARLLIVSCRNSVLTFTSSDRRGRAEICNLKVFVKSSKTAVLDARKIQHPWVYRCILV